MLPNCRFIGWFYTIHSVKDVVKNAILLGILNVIMIPLWITAITWVQVGFPMFLVVLIFILAVNTGYYIYAVVRFIIETKKYGPYIHKKSFTTAEMFMIPKEYLQ